MYETIRIVGKLRPKYVVWENVKNLLSVKHKHNFDDYLNTMKSLGYTSYYQILNAKDYGVPQNRERVFTISIRKDIDKGFEFPPKQELKIRLKDILENEVDGKYYINNAQLERMITTNYESSKFENRVRNEDSIAPTLCARDYKDPKCVATRIGGIFDKENKQHQAGSIWSKEGISPTLDTMQGGYRQPCIITHETPQTVMARKYKVDTDKLVQLLRKNKSELKIRKLTPRECWRLMSFTDEEFDRAAEVNSNSQLYKQARKFHCCKCVGENI